MSRYTSPYQFHDDLEMRDAGYEYKYPKTPTISWTEEDSPQWAYMGEGRPPLCKFHFIRDNLRGDIDD